MQLNPNYGTSVDEESHPMFLHRLNSFSSSFRLRGHPGLSLPRFRSSTAFSSPFIPAPHPWQSVRGFPPWPPRLPHPHPSAHQMNAGNLSHTYSLNASSWCSLHTTSGHMMECTDREPPNKRWKSAEEKKSFEKKGRHEGAAAPRETRSKEWEAKEKHHHLEPRKDSNIRPSQDKTKNRVERAFCWHRSREKSVEWTKSENKGDGTLNQHAQPAASKPQISKSKPEQHSKHGQNPWFNREAAQEPGYLQRNKTGSSVQQRDEGSDGGKGKPLQSKPTSSTQVLNQRHVAQSDRRPFSPRIPQAAKPLQRHWETCSTEPNPPGDSTAFDFSVMSYNILSQDLLCDNSYLYQHCDPSFLPWDYRLPNLLAEIRHLGADILCLQEVQEDHYENQIKPALQTLGYQCVFKKRTGQKPDGCAVVFKTSRFSLLSSTPVEFFRPGDTLLDRDNVGLVVLLQPNNSQSDSSSSICVANTHLLYNPRRGDIKLAQLAILLAEIRRVSRLPDGSTNPVLLCGDFNSVPWSPLYRFLTTGSLEYNGMQIGLVSGQEASPKGHRFLTPPIWSQSLGISYRCQYESRHSEESGPTSPTAVEGGISNLNVEDLASKASTAFKSSRIEHSLNLQSSYQHRLMPDDRPEITTCHSRTALTVDYILYSSGFITQPSLPCRRSLQLLGRLSLVGQSELEEVNCLPNQHHSSDHLPLLANFRFQLSC